MADPFVAEIRIVPFNFAPKGWAFCDGQIMPLSQNTALFSLLGTTYGGNGSSNFALPDMRGRTPVHHGQGPGLSLRSLGETGGNSTVTLISSEIPAHTHSLQASTFPAQSADPTQAVLARTIGGAVYNPSTSNQVAMASDAIASMGGSSPHNNLQPYLTLTFIIALQGVYPPRT